MEWSVMRSNRVLVIRCMIVSIHANRSDNGTGMILVARLLQYQPTAMSTSNSSGINLQLQQYPPEPVQ